MKLNFKAYFALVIIVLQSCLSEQKDAAITKTTIIENDSLTKSWTQNLLNFRNSKNIAFETQFRTERNPFVEHQIDTFMILRFKKSKVRFLVTPIKSFDPFKRKVLMDASLYDPELELSFGLKINSSRVEIEKSLILNFMGDTIIIHGKKPVKKFVLVFKADRLKAVEYSGPLSY